MNNLGLKIRKARKTLGISQRELARRMGVHYNSVYYWEHGERLPRDKKKLILANLLQMSVNELE